jgi:hypothetical protein
MGRIEDGEGQARLEGRDDSENQGRTAVPIDRYSLAWQDTM